MIEFNNDKHLNDIDKQKEQAKIKFENIKNQINQNEKIRLEAEEKLRKEREIIENNRKEAEIQKQKREAKIKIENARAKILINDRMNMQILQAFTRCENNEIHDLKKSLEDKQYYLDTFKDQNKVCSRIKNSIQQEIMQNVCALIDNGIDELKEKNRALFEAIVRVYDEEKNNLITDESIENFINNKIQLISSDVTSTYKTARVLLTTYAYEQKREKTSKWNWFSIKFRKITIYPDGTEEPGDWKEARLEKRSILQLLGEFFFHKNYTYANRISQYQYSQLLNKLND